MNTPKENRNSRGKKTREQHKEAIDTHVRMQEREKDVPRTFTKATNSDLWNAIEYDRELYGEADIISYRRALEWKALNEDVFMMLKEGNELAGTVTFIPLDESIIRALVNDKIRERNIPDWAIRAWTDPNLSVYIPTISIFPTGSDKKDKDRGRSLLCYTIRWALALNRMYDIKNWYAIATTEAGLKLVQELGFTSVKGTREGYVLYDMEGAVPAIKKILKKMEIEEEWGIPLPSNTQKGSSRDPDKKNR